MAARHQLRGCARVAALWLAVGSALAWAHAQPEMKLVGSQALQMSMPAGCHVDVTQGPTRDMFPAGMTFGTATAAYQVEGAASEHGRGPSIWDTFAHTSGKILDNSTGDVACDQYHKYPADVAMMTEMGLDSYRFSISWSRVLPEGRGRVNQEGIDYYNRLIDALVAAGIAPAVTLYHWDLPQALFDATQHGWTDPSIADAFEEYADLCFRTFGDRVKNWITFNEPADTANAGYSTGSGAPGRCSDRATCPSGGNSSTEPYLVAHNILRSHAAAASRYKARYQATQGGKIGITLNCVYHYPATASPEDAQAAQWGMEFMFSWFFDPIWRGDYPPVMRRHVGARLPRFTPAEQKALIGSVDFVGLNFYTAVFASMASAPPPGEASPLTDSWISVAFVLPDGRAIGDPTVSGWLWVVPKAAREILLWITSRYGRIPIIITENGTSDAGALPLAEALCDAARVRYYQSYLANIAQAAQEGANIVGYFAWSFMDNYEWGRGYTERFGIVYVNFTDDARPRTPKASALWFSNFLKGGAAAERGGKAAA